MARISKRFVDGLRAGEKQRIEWDADLKGFGVGELRPCVQLSELRTALLFGGRPAAVAGFVVPVVVDAVDGVAGGWPLAHVCEEVGEVEPAATDRDSASAVAWKGDRIGVRTPRFHSCPNAVLGTPLPDPAVSVLEVEVGGDFASDASTGVGDAQAQRWSINHRLSTAIAATQPPSRSGFLGLNSTQDNAPSESSARHVYQPSHTSKISTHTVHQKATYHA